MIEHLRGREKELEPLGWSGPEAEWIALVCLHSGIFTRSQFCHYFDAWRSRAQRFVEALLDRGVATEAATPMVAGGARACQITSKPIYRALGVENIRHRRKASPNVVMRRLLSLDYVLEHPGAGWLPTEPEKVRCFEALGLDRGLMPRRIYRGTVGNRKRYFVLKLPVAVDGEIATFAYVDPGNETDTEIRSWGIAHGRLWEALRNSGRQVRVVAIAAEHENVERAERRLRAWAEGVPRKHGARLTVKEERALIERAIIDDDRDVLDSYGGLNPAIQRTARLASMTDEEMGDGISIDGYATFRAIRFASPEDGFASAAEDSWKCVGSRGQMG